VSLANSPGHCNGMQAPSWFTGTELHLPVCSYFLVSLHGPFFSDAEVNEYFRSGEMKGARLEWMNGPKVIMENVEDTVRIKRR
jgi:hypothetical protein